MRIVLRLMAGVLALALASPAAAYGDRYGYRDDGDTYRGQESCCRPEPAPYEPYREAPCCERRQAPPRDWREDDCGCYGEIRLNDSFFADSGGVGPVWLGGGGGGGGGGFVIVGGGASAGASASASASASARASVSVRFRGGYRGGHGGHGGHHGGGGGCGC